MRFGGVRVPVGAGRRIRPGENGVQDMKIGASRAGIAVAATVACVMGLTAPGAQAENLAEEVEALVEDHPQIQAARRGLDASHQNIRREKSGFLPQASITAGAGYEHTDSLATRALGLENQQYFATNATVEVRQNLFSGFSRFAGTASANALKRASENTLAAVRQNVILEGVTAYLNVLRSRELVRLNAGNERAIREQLELEDERVTRGSGISVDVLLAKSRLQIAREQSIAFEGALKDSISTYIQVFGHPPTLESMVPMQVPPSMLPESKEAAAVKLQAENPVIKIASAQADSAMHEIDRAQSTYYPSVDLVGSANIENNFAGVEDVRQDYAVKLELTWQLFDGFLTPANSAEANARYREAIQGGRDVSRKTVELMEISWHEMEVAKERAELLRNAMNIAGEVFQSRIELREAGKETAINVLDAENELFSACINFVNAFFDSQVAAFRVLNTLGRLDTRAVAQSTPVDNSAVVAQCGFSPSEGGGYQPAQ